MARHIRPRRNPYPPVSLNPMTFLDTSSNRWSDRILFSPKEVSELTGVPLSGIYELCYSGQLQAFKIGKPMAYSSRRIVPLLKTSAGHGDYHINPQQHLTNYISSYCKKIAELSSRQFRNFLCLLPRTAYHNWTVGRFSSSAGWPCQKVMIKTGLMASWLASRAIMPVTPW